MLQVINFSPDIPPISLFSRNVTFAMQGIRDCHLFLEVSKKYGSPQRRFLLIQLTSVYWDNVDNLKCSNFVFIYKIMAFYWFVF